MISGSRHGRRPFTLVDARGPSEETFANTKRASGMACHICGHEAVGRCYNCGELFCAEHGAENCARCTSAFQAGDPRAELVSRLPLHDMAHGAWWRPQPAEGYSPPACYCCKGIARQSCLNCGERYCPDHAGVAGVCAQCGKSSRLGMIILVAVAAVFGCMWLLSLTR
jgi:hypothetical protein